MQDLNDTESSQVESAELLVTRKVLLARDIWLFELRSRHGACLPAFTPGAHVTVQTPAGHRRSYSLCNDPGQCDVYQIALKRDAAGRGGSISMADDVHEGDLLRVGLPQNHFELAPRASNYVFIAGGIGITPILSMMRFLRRAGRTQYRGYYCTRDAESAAFLQELQSDPQVRVHHDRGDAGQALDLWPVLEKPSNAHVYCCGPRGLMDSVRDMSGHWPSGSVHFESFGVDAAARACDRPLRVRLAKTGVVLDVGSDQSILEALRQRGIRVPSSCESGVCGACKTRLAEGEADHRDLVLTEREKDSHIIVCVSRARSAELVLDL